MSLCSVLYHPPTHCCKVTMQTATAYSSLSPRAVPRLGCLGCPITQRPRATVSAAREQPSSAASSSSSEAPAEPAVPIRREWKSLGSKVVESNVPFADQGEAQPDFWEGEKFENFGKILENYFVPGIIVLGLICGGLAARTYNEGADTYIKPPTDPNESAIIISSDVFAKGPSLSAE